MTVYAAQQKYRQVHHARVQRIRSVYKDSGAHAQVKRAIQGSSAAGIRGRDFDGGPDGDEAHDLSGARASSWRSEASEAGLPATNEELQNLKGDALKAARDAEEKLKKERLLVDKTVLNELYEPGTWRCSRCDNAIAPTVKTAHTSTGKVSIRRSLGARALFNATVPKPLLGAVMSEDRI
jgi:hypothetical protein